MVDMMCGIICHDIDIHIDTTVCFSVFIFFMCIQ